ncbi:hypothetical protein CH371_13565 [Leptospira wolffii]|uniref:Uncharacterized protein n=1 Tax=Leptospira wolffii TaxID=409998 RepID=A0A2M9ZAH7_9LEPT|nr:hypothetical protein CH371_13565 [Leptospira wolffii]
MESENAPIRIIQLLFVESKSSPILLNGNSVPPYAESAGPRPSSGFGEAGLRERGREFVFTRKVRFSQPKIIFSI